MVLSLHLYNALISKIIMLPLFNVSPIGQETQTFSLKVSITVFNGHTVYTHLLVFHGFDDAEKYSICESLYFDILRNRISIISNVCFPSSFPLVEFHAQCNPFLSERNLSSGEKFQFCRKWSFVFSILFSFVMVVFYRATRKQGVPQTYKRKNCIQLRAVID